MKTTGTARSTATRPHGSGGRHERLRHALLDDARRHARHDTGLCASTEDRSRRHRLDDRRDRPRADDDDPGPGAVLRRHGAQEERARHHGAEPRGASHCVACCGSLLGYTSRSRAMRPLLGNLDRALLHGIGDGRVSPLAKTIPESLFMLYQMTFAIITVALVAGSVADRMRFSAFLLFSALWLFVVYVPIAHWVWGGGLLRPTACSISPAARWCTSMPASPAWSPPGARQAARLRQRQSRAATICRWR